MLGHGSRPVALPAQLAHTAGRCRPAARGCGPESLQAASSKKWNACCVEWAVRFTAAGFTDRKEGRAGSVLPLTRRDVSSSVPLPGQPWSPRRPAHLNVPDVRSTPRLCALAGSASSTPGWGANECSSRRSSNALAASPWLLAVCVQLGLATRKAQDVGRNSKAATEPASLAAAGAS